MNANIRRLLTIMALAACLLAQQADARRVSHQYNDNLLVGEHKRHYVIRVPDACLSKNSPLVILLHGGLTNARFVAYESKMSRKSDADEFILVYPQGTGGIGKNLLTWNAGDCCGPAQWKASQDVEFVRALVEELPKKYKIDPDRIYVAGVSNGGMLAMKCANELSDVLAAVASVNGCLMDKSGTAPKHPVSLIAFNGTKDDVIRTAGGVGSMLGYKIDCPPAEETIKHFASQLGCDSTPKVEHTGEVTKEVYSSPSGTEVCLYTIPIKHFWPGGRRPYPTIGRNHDSLNASDVMCDFFWSHPKNRRINAAQSGAAASPQ